MTTNYFIAQRHTALEEMSCDSGVESCFDGIITVCRNQMQECIDHIADHAAVLSLGAISGHFDRSECACYHLPGLQVRTSCFYCSY